MIISLSDHVNMCKIQKNSYFKRNQKGSFMYRYERINKWAAIVKALCDKPRRDKHCCEKVKQIPYPKFKDRESVKAFHNNVDLVYLPVCSLRLSQTVMRKVYDEPQTISQGSLYCE